MNDGAATASTMAAAAQSIRDTGKWLVGGVVATAAGVFAGSSLTSFGSLDPKTDTSRLCLAIGGLAVGFVGLGWIMYLAVRVLARESITFRELAIPLMYEPAEISSVRLQMLRRYMDALPDGTATFADYVKLIDLARNADPQTEETRDFLARSQDTNVVLIADAVFMLVRERFQRLITGLALATPLVVFGLGLFAWAANPPKPTPDMPVFSLSIRGGANHKQ